MAEEVRKDKALALALALAGRRSAGTGEWPKWCPSCGRPVQSTPFRKVTIIAEAGRCDAAYRYPVKIVNGAVVYDTAQGGAVAQISGQVNAWGQVPAVPQHGSQQAVGAGRLFQASGGGTWTGETQSEACSGRWEAARTLD